MRHQAIDGFSDQLAVALTQGYLKSLSARCLIAFPYVRKPMYCARQGRIYLCTDDLPRAQVCDELQGVGDNIDGNQAVTYGSYWQTKP